MVPGQRADLGAGPREAVHVPQPPLALQGRGRREGGGGALPQRDPGHRKV